MKLILVGGSLATGKTTVSRILSEATGIARVSMDEIKERLFDELGSRDREWSKEIGRRAFPIFQQKIEEHLSNGASVIAEATFLWPEDAQWVHELQQRYGAELVQIWMTADPRVARERFVTRAESGERHPGHNDTLEEVITEFDERFFNKSFVPLPIHARVLVVDTTDLGSVDHDAIRKFV
jgi:predicted kinase